MSSRAAQRLYSTAVKLARTPLYESHVRLGGKMVPYAGFDMPVLYKDQSHIDSHNWVRSKVGLFDVSHMLQHNVSGKDSVEFLQKITPIDLNSLPIGSFSLSVLLNEQGGVIDDCIITKHGDYEYYIVTNAGCRDKDVEFIKKEAANFGDVSHSTFESTLLAIQGPKAAELLQKFTNEDLSKIYFGQAKYLKLSPFGDSPIHLARSGYTGEDGFELSIPSSSEVETKASILFFDSLIEENPDLVKPIGLAARDSLRLEAGMCLYGHELAEDITPVQASLSWLIPKSRRTPETATFNGASTILSQLKDKTLLKTRRIGLASKGPAPRDHNKIFNVDGEEIGYVTSGSPSPTLGGNVAQAYINKKAKIGELVKLEVRNKLRDATITKLPFVASNLYKP
ncbi:Aminomethyltransferase, mitochondrial [Scheffersomyces spartinae]|uniref:Aminomethyltransferase n=1 Tax=Scheffersomyces spartinae TaxID=45513 RepID=A0A9P7VBU4_9ASCO|nr:Aminomethyltransferase, mitochondrial [Scheffersomyces spartinae]KAG7194928.1 Aminomethyltransferase, mitochondrial [Scheffersomyces spartinae]